MERTKVFEIIEKERTYQDQTYKPSEVLGGSGLTRGERDRDVTAHMVLLDLYVNKAKEAWNVKGDNRPALQQIAKIAAIATRAIERAANDDYLVTHGLR
jgi:hypothetical protein